MIKVKETADEAGAWVFIVEFDDWKGTIHELVIKVPTREYDETTIEDRIIQAVETERSRILANEAAKHKGKELEETTA